MATDYEQKYKEALERAKKFEDKYGGDYAGYIFPELAESEDEKIRKEIIHYILYKANGVSEKQEHEWIAYLEKQKDQKPAEKQDYSGLNDLERAIHRGFLSAGVENVPITIIKETAKECIAQMKPAEWSEEDDCVVVKDGYAYELTKRVE